MAITPSNYSYRQLITGVTPSATNTDQKLTIDGGSLDSTFWSNVQSDGGDIRICENSDGTGQLPLDIIEPINVGAQTIVMQTLKPTYSSGSRGVYVFCGTTTTDTQPAASAAFGSQAVHVNTPYMNHMDGTGLLNSADGTSGTFESGTPTSVAAKIGDGRDFTSEGIATGQSFLASASSFAISAWVEWQGPASGDEGTIWDQWAAGNTTVFFRYDPGSLTLEFNVFDGAVTSASYSQSLQGAGLNHIVAVHDGSNLRMYVNGSEIGTPVSAGAITRTSPPNAKIGRSIANNTGNDFWIGILDEVQVGPAPTASYIDIQYQNENNPSTFWTQSTPDDPSGGGGTITVTGATSTYSYTAQTATIDLTGTIAVTGATPSYSYAAVSASIDLTPEITVTGATATYSYSAINGVVELGAVINVTGQTPNYSYSAQNATVTLQGAIDVTGQTPSYSYTAISAAVQVGKIVTNVSFVGTVKTAEFLGALPQLEFSGTIKQQQFSGEIKQAASFIGARK